MKVALINYSDTNGGAARAAYRIHRALLRLGIDSSMFVNDASAGDWSVQRQVSASKWEKALARMRPTLVGWVRRLLKTANPIIHSPAVVPTNWSKRLNGLDADLLHLHWVNFEMLSIADIGRLSKPAVWTLHDMWAFCGAEHLTEDNRWREGYTPRNRPNYETGFDLNRWTWQRKRKHWQRPMHIVTPSRWLAKCVRQSALMRDWPVTVIPNAIDTSAWQPVDKCLARQLLGLPTVCPLITFGTSGENAAPHKGFDLLKSALVHLRGQMPGLELIVFGQLTPQTLPELGFPIHYIGHLHEDISLRLLYSAVDALVIPSRLDNLPNTGVEAHACGTPVVAFDTCGLPDIVEHQQTGYLAKAFEAEDLARGIQWVLSDVARHKMLSQAAREKAVRCFDYPVVAQQYLHVYRKIIK